MKVPTCGVVVKKLAAMGYTLWTVSHTTATDVRFYD